jgi:hypothetical protein
VITVSGKPMINPDVLKNFEKAFRGRVNGCRRRCDCGIEYWDAHNFGYDWEEGEVDALQADPNARPLPYAVGLIEFEGRYFVDGCSCWHPRAERIIAWLQQHADGIAQFLTLEKRRKQLAADIAPTVEGFAND